MGMVRGGWWGPTRTDAGLGLVEVVISMLLLTAITGAARPLVIAAMQSSVGNRETARADAFTDSIVAALRAQLVGSAMATLLESRGAVTGEAVAETGSAPTHITPGTCPAKHSEGSAVSVAALEVAAPGTLLQPAV
jgi:Tfp pilus assembly protein PilV